MKQPMTLEQLKQAYDVGATHYYISEIFGVRFVKYVNNNIYVYMDDDFWVNFTTGLGFKYDINKIDYSPLNGD